MSTKHTPGPWNVDYASHDDGGCSVRAIDRTLALHVSQEDAFLIAAAPELLEALRGMVDAHAVPSSICKERPVYESALSAIAKATGEAA